jgi:peptidoglycan hydrolase-like protein with peptidoglycan-binding domain
MLADLPILKKGDRNERVKALQDTLSRVGYKVVIDGIYGLETEGAVRSFQTRYGLVSDGIVGNMTLARLQEVALGASNKGTLLPTTQSVQAGMFTGMYERFQGPGVTGYPIWIEAVSAFAAIYGGMKLIDFSKSRS